MEEGEGRRRCDTGSCGDEHHVPSQVPDHRRHRRLRVGQVEESCGRRGCDTGSCGRRGCDTGSCISCINYNGNALQGEKNLFLWTN